MRSGAVPKEPPRPYQFTNEWFSTTADLEVWNRIIGHVKPTSFLEVGCYEGQATTYLIEACAQYGPLSVTCVDTWQGAVDLPPERMAGVEARFDSNVELARKYGDAIVEKIKMPSSEALPKLIAEGRLYDFIYIDGSHTAPDVLTDAVDAFRLLREGGAMIFDDYAWAMEDHGKEDLLNMPKPAIDAFFNLFYRRVKLVHSHAQLALLKIA